MALSMFMLLSVYESAFMRLSTAALRWPSAWSVPVRTVWMRWHWGSASLTWAYRSAWLPGDCAVTMVNEPLGV